MRVISALLFLPLALSRRRSLVLIPVTGASLSPPVKAVGGAGEGEGNDDEGEAGDKGEEGEREDDEVTNEHDDEIDEGRPSLEDWVASLVPWSLAPLLVFLSLGAAVL